MASRAGSAGRAGRSALSARYDSRGAGAVRHAGPVLARAQARSETEIVKAILDYLAANRIVAWRNNTGAAMNPAGRLVRFGTPGMPDIAGVLPGGRALFLEVKGRHGRLNPHQQRMISWLLATGALVAVVRSIEDTRGVLHGAGLEVL